jgi:hypothetical protein
MVEDDDKVRAYLASLNNNSTSGVWIAADGFFIWGQFVFGQNGQGNQINAGEGIVVKVFFNNSTGEIKTVLAQAMVRNA